MEVACRIARNFGATRAGVFTMRNPAHHGSPPPPAGRSAGRLLNLIGNASASLRCARDSVQHPFAVLVCLDRLPREGQMRIAFDDSGPLRYDGEARKKRRQSYAA